MSRIARGLLIALVLATAASAQDQLGGLYGMTH